MAHRTTSVEPRGQSGVDFIIGFGVFFLTLSFVLVLIPDLLSPFAQQEGPVVADRAIETLGSDLLAGGTVGTLNATCTGEFFEKSGTSCGFDASDSTTALLGISDEHQVNVMLENHTASQGIEVACYDRDNSGVVDCSTAGADFKLARGPSPPGDSQSVRAARRVVRVDGETYFLELRVW